jgi:hypothetical protein
MPTLTEQEKTELYSADVQQSVYTQQQTNNISDTNVILIILYYVFLSYYTYYAYGSFRYSTEYYKKLIMILLLFAYPFIIYPIQYNVYNFGKYLISLVYNNIYETNDW